ncbi:MAG: histidine--tRNA ligase [Bdellovibrio sp.]
MSQKLQPVRGTQDLLPEQSQIFRYLDDTARSLASKFNYDEIDTPIFEFTDVFHRTLGETSDAVTKETYTFTDRGGESLTLRPEGTAGIARAFVSNGMAQNLPLKFYYSGPMFRYERPQKGRQRQFHQLGVECLGFDTPESDVECISLGALLFERFGLQNKVQLEINSLGDTESRLKHRDLLVHYLAKFENDLSTDSKVRLHKNPLRILDSKDEGDRKILAGAPNLSECLNDESKKFFDKVLKGLADLRIKTVVNDKLVRGFDYYTHSVFEFSTTHLGAQSAVLAGGRYNGLIALMGGPQTPGVGWASGMERLALLIDAQTAIRQEPLICVLPAEDRAEEFCHKLVYDLRKRDQKTEILLGGNFGKRMKKADKLGATKVYIIGGSELDAGTVTVKDLKSGEQTAVLIKDI